MVEKKQYPAIDIAKFICALVILLYHYFSEHGPVFWVLEESLSMYAVAVALFMTISGFLIFEKLNSAETEERKRSIVKSQVRRILSIYILWSIPYIVFQVVTWDWANIDAWFILNQIRSWVFNSTFSTIWFMPALAVAIILSYFLSKHLTWRQVCVVALGFYILGALQLTYSFVMESVPEWSGFIKFSNTWLQGPRGGLFFGMPLVVLGGTAARIQTRNTLWSLFSSAGFMLLLLIEAVALKVLVGGCGLDLTISMLPLCFSLVLFVTSLQWKMAPRYKWMRSMSTLIFMSQRLFLTVIPHFFTVGFSKMLFANPYVGCGVLCGLTLLFAELIFVVSKKWRPLKQLY